MSPIDDEKKAEKKTNVLLHAGKTKEVQKKTRIHLVIVGETAAAHPPRDSNTLGSTVEKAAAVQGAY